MPQQPHSHTSDCCAEIGELLSAYLDGELSAEEQQKIDIHLQSCPDCARLANALGTLRREIAETQLIPPPHLHDNIMSRVHRENKLRRLRRFTAIGSVGTAAMLCVVIMSSAIVGTMSADNSPNDNAQARYYYAADEVEMVNEHSYITVIDTTIEAALDMTATQAPTGTDDAKSDEVIISTTYSTTSYSEPADSVVGTEAPHESVQPEAADCTKSIVAAKLPENLRSLSVLDQLSVTAWKTPEAETNAADTDTLLGVSVLPSARLAEQQLGILCTVEFTEGDTTVPYVYDLTDGRRLTLANFMGDEMEELAAIFPLEPNTPFCPTAEGLVLHLAEDEIIILVWDAFPSLGKCVSRFAMDVTPLLSPDGAVLHQ